MISKIYAGIGSRKTPPQTIEFMTAFAFDLQRMGWWLSSGGAAGADTAFEVGAADQKMIYHAKDATPAALELAAKFHPAWHHCDDHARALHARNGMIVLGPQLDTPVQFVACWTQAGLAGGGTGQALRIAAAYDIPVFNFFDQGAVGALANFIKHQGE